MAFDEDDGRRWAELCERHDAAKAGVNAAWFALHAKFTAIGRGQLNVKLTTEELTRLASVRARRNAIEREMDEFMTTRRHSVMDYLNAESAPDELGKMSGPQSGALLPVPLPADSTGA